MSCLSYLSSLPLSRNSIVVLLNFLIGLTVGLFLTTFLPGSPHSVQTGVGDTSEGAEQNTQIKMVTSGALKADLPMVTPSLPVKQEQDSQVPIKFEDQHHHHDDIKIADALYGKVRVLCWVMTQPSSHEKRAKHVKATWGQRCNLLLFMSEGEDQDLPAIKLTVEPGRSHLTAKTMQAFDYVYKYHGQDFDWFLKADDDTYVIVENLRYMLSAHSPSELIYFGHHFYSDTWTDMYQGYFSGGGGYVVSRAALEKFGLRADNLCAMDNGSEDVEFGYCMEKLKVKTGDSRDSLGRSRFHCFGPEDHMHGRYPKWYHTFDKYGAPWGIGNMSDYAVSFHYVKPQKMYALEFFVYHLRPFGITSGEQLLNRAGS